MPIGNLLNLRHVGRLPVEVDRQNRFRSRCDGAFNQFDVNQIGARVDVNQDRGRAGVVDGQDRSDEGVGGGNDFIAGSNSHGPERQMKRFGTISHTNAVIRAAKVSEIAFKRRQRLAENELRVADDTLNCFRQFLPQLRAVDI